MSLPYTRPSYDLLLHLEWNLDFTLASSKPYMIPCDPRFPPISLTFLVAQSVKNPPAVKETSCNAGDPSLIPGSGRSPGEGNGNQFQYSCLGNPMDRGAWWATVHGVSRVRCDIAPKLLLAVWLKVSTCTHMCKFTQTQEHVPTYIWV